MILVIIDPLFPLKPVGWELLVNYRFKVNDLYLAIFIEIYEFIAFNYYFLISRVKPLNLKNIANNAK